MPAVVIHTADDGSNVMLSTAADPPQNAALATSLMARKRRGALGRLRSMKEDLVKNAGFSPRRPGVANMDES